MQKGLNPPKFTLELSVLRKVGRANPGVVGRSEHKTHSPNETKIMKKVKSILGALLALCVLASTAVAGEKAINDKCPLSGKGVNASKTSTVEIEVCCNNCKGKVEKNPAAHLAKAAKASKGECVLSGKAAKTSAKVQVGFCCGNCKAKFDKDPKKFLGKVKAAKKKKA